MFNVVPSAIVFVEGEKEGAGGGNRELALDVSCMHSHLVQRTYQTHAGASLVLPVKITWRA